MIENYSNTKKTLELIQLRMQAIDTTLNTFTEEKENLEKMHQKLKHILKQMDKTLKELTGIEHKLYYEIVVNGTNVNQSVEKVSLYNDMSVSTIWKNYYPHVKQKLKELEEEVLFEI